MENAKAKTLGAVNLDDLDFYHYCFSISRILLSAMKIANNRMK